MRNNRLRLVVSGAMGRMGQALVRHVADDEGCELVGAVERPDHPELGRDIGQLALCRPLAVSLEHDLRNALIGAQAVIDFSAPEASARHADLAAQAGVALVVGTTGLHDEQKARIRAAAEKTRVVLAPNMSVGVNLLFYLARRAAETIGADTDIEIVETHHRLKVDAPSGTALRLAEVVGEALAVDDLAERLEHGRQGRVGPRADGRIGMHAVRGGDIVGRHDLHFFGPGEELCLTHAATSRDNFVRGAIRAAHWLQKQPPGLYDMGDVLGLK
jgi:4-hydroxy-tetrahydrodipicolinate reductase